MSKIEKEYNKILFENFWGLVYQKLGLQCQQYTFTCIEAKKAQNRQLNRYRDVSPYDHSRIKLQRIKNDYINASLVEIPRANRKYILTQGPLACTSSHFWLMVWEQNCPAILMLNKVIEKHEVKCHYYWPHGVGEKHKLHFSEVKLTVEQISEEDLDFYTIRVIRIYDFVSETSRDVIQFHYMTWPDFGVPTCPAVFLEFLNLVRTSGALNMDRGPAVVHCSAGIGRSGTFCLVDSCLVIAEIEGENSLDVQQTLLQMRRGRMGLIQTPDQLRFSYEAIIEGAKSFDPNRTLKPFEFQADVESADILHEESPPAPPPRSESLAAAPARPLPAIPASASMGNLETSPNMDSSSSEGAPATPPIPYEYESSSCDDAEDQITYSHDSEIRRRRNRELAERVSAMKKRARDNEHWQTLKRSFCKPITITIGFLLAGIIVYSYVRH